MKHSLLVISALLLTAWAALGAEASGPPKAKPMGLTNGPNASVLKEGKPYRGIGINYFDCFLRTLKKSDDTSYDAGFATLAAKGIPFARFCATGFWPKDMELYQKDRAEYFKRLEEQAETNAKGSGLGYLTLIKDYGVRFGFRFRQVTETSVAVDVQAHIQRQEH